MLLLLTFNMGSFHSFEAEGIHQINIQLITFFSACDKDRLWVGITFKKYVKGVDFVGLTSYANYLPKSSTLV